MVLSILLSVVVALLVTPYLHIVISRTPSHLHLRKVPIHCSNCGVTVLKKQRNSLVAKLTKDNLCHNCLSPIWNDSPRLEIAVVILFGIVGAVLGLEWALPAYWVFFFAAVAVVVVDLRHYLIPTKVVYPAVGIGLVLLALASLIEGDFGHLQTGVIAMIGCWVFYFICWFVFPAGMGFGDVRLALLIGLFTGFLELGNALLALMLGLLSGALIGGALVVAKKRTRKDVIPFAPFMILGAALAILAAGPISALT